MNEPSPSGAVVTELILEIFRLNRLLLDTGDRMTRPVGLTSARWQVLGVVEHGPTPVARVARTMGLTRQSVQQTADALAADGFIAYTDNPHHRRARLMTLTPAGRAALAHVVEQQIAWANRLAEEHGPDDLRAAALVLRRLRARLEEDAGPPADEEG